MSDRDEFENLADWLGEQEFARNQSDYTDEQTTYVHVDVDVLAERLMQAPWLAAHDADVRKAALANVRRIVNGPHSANSGLDSFTLAWVSAALGDASWADRIIWAYLHPAEANAMLDEDDVPMKTGTWK